MARTRNPDVTRARRAETLARNAAQGRQSQATLDSFQNFVASVGQGTNNVASAGGYGFDPITRRHVELEWLYRGSWIGQVAVDTKADDMMSAGIDLGSELSPDDSEKLLRSMQIHGTWDKLRTTNKWARLYGGAIAVLMIDGQKLDTPLKLDTISPGQFKGITVLDRWMVNPSLGDLVSELGDDTGMPRFYQVTVALPGLGNQSIHHSRCLRLDGIELPYWQKVTENYWSLSVIEPLWDRLLAFDSTTLGAAQLVYKAYIRIWKVKGLRNILGGNTVAEQALIANAQWMRTFQTNEGISLVDSEDDFSAIQYSFGGLSDTLQQFAQQLSGALQIPLVRLFGQSPSGFSSGDTDLRNYYDGVGRERESHLRRPIDKLLRVHARSEQITLPPGFWWDFNPLWSMSHGEKATVATQVTGAVAQALENGIISPKIAAKELKQSSKETGVFSNIDDEFVEGLDDAPPAIGEGLEAMEGGMPGMDPGMDPEEPRADVEEDAALQPRRARGHVHFHVVDGQPREITLHGLPIYIETFRGQERKGLRGWSVKMPCDYGFFKNTGSAEGASEGLDCFIGTDHASDSIFVIDQVNPSTGAFDEHKCMVGFATRQLALRDYQRAFNDGSGSARIGGVKQMSVAQFKKWLEAGDVTRPAA